MGRLGEGVLRKRVYRIFVVRLRGVIRGPARAERSCEVMWGIVEMEVVRRDG